VVTAEDVNFGTVSKVILVDIAEESLAVCRLLLLELLIAGMAGPHNPLAMEPSGPMVALAEVGTFEGVHLVDTEVHLGSAVAAVLAGTVGKILLVGMMSSDDAAGHDLLAYIVGADPSDRVVANDADAVHSAVGTQVHSAAGMEEHSAVGMEEHYAVGMEVHSAAGMEEHFAAGIEVHSDVGTEEHFDVDMEVLLVGTEDPLVGIQVLLVGMEGHYDVGTEAPLVGIQVLLVGTEDFLVDMDAHPGSTVDHLAGTEIWKVPYWDHVVVAHFSPLVAYQHPYYHGADEHFVTTHCHPYLLHPTPLPIAIFLHDNFLLLVMSVN
jgi:hypothetical protein